MPGKRYGGRRRIFSKEATRRSFKMEAEDVDRLRWLSRVWQVEQSAVVQRALRDSQDRLREEVTSDSSCSCEHRIT